MTSIRPLTAADVDALVSALAQAFERDDLAVWIFPDPAERGAALVAMFRSRLSDGLHHDGMVVDVAEDLDGAAIWQSPLAPFDEAPPPGARSDVVEAFRTISAARPQQRSWYLHGIGARIEHRGIGSALMRVGLRRCDDAALPSALWTGHERNLDFYRKHGYRELQRFDFPGASAWWMWRDPV